MEVDKGILAIFGEPPEGTNLSENGASKNDAAVVAMLVLAIIAIILRFTARATQRSRVHYDDVVIILALGFVGGTVGLSIAGGVHGAGKHVWAVTIPDLVGIYKILFSYTYLYGSACAAVKISILLFYQRVFQTGIKDISFRILMALGYFLSISYPIIIWATMSSCCKPLSFYWTQFEGTKGECIDVKKFFLALAVINMINDVFILAIPIPQILKLQMSTKKKVAVTGIMLLGGFVCIASIFRILYLSNFMKAVDITWLMGPVFIWSAIEPSIAIVSACLPHLAPLGRLARKKLSTTNSRSHGQSNGNENSSSTPWRQGLSSHQDGTKRSRSRFGFNNDKNTMVKLPESDGADDEIGLTNRVTANSITGKANSVSSSQEFTSINNPDGRADGDKSHNIVVKSSIVQYVAKR